MNRSMITITSERKGQKRQKHRKKIMVVGYSDDCDGVTVATAAE